MYFIDTILDAFTSYPHKIYGDNEIIQNSILNEDNYGDYISHTLMKRYNFCHTNQISTN